ncbi:CTP synthase [Striga asiatica]|uniref:CTP synthase n=1 Tax=Striga asiatica TaxID=4170 RepID=A0A5A7PZ78_STRAF|nr:CTP synthase [Striga asiatica]
MRVSATAFALVAQSVACSVKEKSQQTKRSEVIEAKQAHTGFSFCFIEVTSKFMYKERVRDGERDALETKLRKNAGISTMNMSAFVSKRQQRKQSQLHQTVDFTSPILLTELRKVRWVGWSGKSWERRANLAYSTACSPPHWLVHWPYCNKNKSERYDSSIRTLLKRRREGLCIDTEEPCSKPGGLPLFHFVLLIGSSSKEHIHGAMYTTPRIIPSFHRGKIKKKKRYSDRAFMTSLRFASFLWVDVIEIAQLPIWSTERRQKEYDSIGLTPSLLTCSYRWEGVSSVTDCSFLRRLDSLTVPAIPSALERKDCALVPISQSNQIKKKIVEHNSHSSKRGQWLQMVWLTVRSKRSNEKLFGHDFQKAPLMGGILGGSPPFVFFVFGKSGNYSRVVRRCPGSYSSVFCRYWSIEPKEKADNPTHTYSKMGNKAASVFFLDKEEAKSELDHYQDFQADLFRARVPLSGEDAGLFTLPGMV